MGGGSVVLLILYAWDQIEFTFECNTNLKCKRFHTLRAGNIRCFCSKKCEYCYYIRRNHNKYRIKNTQSALLFLSVDPYHLFFAHVRRKSKLRTIFLRSCYIDKNCSPARDSNAWKMWNLRVFLFKRPKRKKKCTAVLHNFLGVYFVVEVFFF